jgi:hypothetical protein
MKKYFPILLLSFGFLVNTSLFAQIIRIDSTSNWKKSFKAGLNLNQASFSSNWKGGGINSIGLTSLVNFKANYKNGKASWDNEIDLQYGFVRNSGQGFRKTMDRIFIDTKYGYALSKKWDVYTSLNFSSQFAPGYVYHDDDSSSIISDFLAPAFITSSWGLEYHPVDYFKVRISPFSPRFTIVKDGERFAPIVSDKPYGVDTTETVRTEWAAFQITADFNKDIAKNINLKWRYLLFANYETLEFKKIDHRLDLNLTARVSKFVTTSFGFIMLYDYDQDSKAQISQLLNIGLLYTFQNYEDKK